MTRCPAPQNGMMNDNKLPMDMNKNRYEKPVQTPPWGTEVANPDCSTFEQRIKTTAAEVCSKSADKAESSRCQEPAVAAEGAGTGGTTNERGRSMDCNKGSTTVRTLPTNCDEFMEPMSGRVSPVMTETAPTDGTGVMQYRWGDRESVGMTEVLMPRNYLEIPEPRLPRVLLDLAEEARNVILENGWPCYTEDVQPKGTGLIRPVLVTVMIDSQPVLNKRVSRVTGTSTEMILNMNVAGRREPVDRSGPTSTTEQPVLFGLNTDERGNNSAGPVGPDVNSAGRGGPVGPGGPTE